MKTSLAGKIAAGCMRWVLVAAVTFSAPSLQAATPSEREAQLIAVLSSEASLFEKARACQQLGEIGSREAVPALAGLLSDVQLSAYARSGLEGIPGPEAAAALRNAAGTLKGPLLAGVLNSLGARRDAQSVELLARFASDPQSGVAREALLALGNIASPESIRILAGTLQNAAPSLREEAAAACLLAADRLRVAGDASAALALYEQLRKAEIPAACLSGATRGAILAHKQDQAAFLIEQLRSPKLILRNAALLTIREIPSDTLAKALNAELAASPPELQGQILLALVDCHNAESIFAVGRLTRAQDQELRQAAIRVLSRLGPEAAQELLAGLERKPSAEDKKLLLKGLAEMEGEKVNELLIARLRAAPQPKDVIDLIPLLEARRAVAASGELVRLAAGEDAGVKVAALLALQTLATPKDLPQLVAVLKSTRLESARAAAEGAIAWACRRSGPEAPAAETVFRELQQTSDPVQRNAWIRVLANVGYAPALPAIYAAARDPNTTVSLNAVAELGQWPNPAPMEVLLETLASAPAPAVRSRALGSVLDLAAVAADDAQCPAETVVKWLQPASSAARSASEKRRLLGILGRLKTEGSFRLLAAHLEDPELRAEAAAGIIQIAPALAGSASATALKASLEKIAASVNNQDLRTRATQAAKALSAQEAGVSLFDGQTLAGWEGSTNVWRVRQGVIVGGSLQGNPRNEFLATIRSYTNFVLRLEYKLVGTEGFINSGVQLRSVRISNPPNEMKGYQADIGAGYSGSLYDESRRNTFLAKARDEQVQRLEKPGDWNRYEVRCEGPHIQIWLNGEKTVDYQETDATIPQSGWIALQIHGDCKAEVAFRNIAVREF
jgi:HEAT repeat protein